MLYEDEKGNAVIVLSHEALMQIANEGRTVQVQWGPKMLVFASQEVAHSWLTDEDITRHRVESAENADD